MRGSHVPRPVRALAWSASCIVLGCAVDTREFDEPALDRALHDATGYHLRASGEDEVTMPPGEVALTADAVAPGGEPCAATITVTVR